MSPRGLRRPRASPGSSRKATGYARTCEKKQIYIQDHELLVGGVGFKPRCGILNPDSAAGRHREGSRHDLHPSRLIPFYMSEDAKRVYLEEVKDYWKNKCVLDRWNLMLPEDTYAACAPTAPSSSTARRCAATARPPSTGA